ncbi:uncharacterized protein LAESUDRAFT_726375 [Laetiporus sulphureus 93-53]|uniref:Uncharacterized protein n=1 Tax=Laetiporus sulphureus 93-53 TaxID=1314785 RepID=A0A165E3B9_9APHY|nr:uncharacterized protein LAESUDRAFT_726375 [Laetiporus sulphureus 93-53]KZT06163.1 hypothetical protein LAESUDRAFT_726375 [Laetiporus sulphureus 93-53]
MGSGAPTLRRSLFIYLAFILMATLVSPTPTNFTIDDEYGDSVSGLQPIYQPSWNYGPQCPGCAIHPEKDETFDQTWHDTTIHPEDPSYNVTLMFNGTAIWVYCIIPFSQVNVVTFVNLTFELDGDYVGAFSHQSDDYMSYNITVYSNTSMENQDHTLVMTLRNDIDASVALFDWAQYTYDPEPEVVSSSTFSISNTSSSTYSETESSTRTYEPYTLRLTSSFTSSSIPALTSHSSSKSSKSPTGAIAGGIIGGISALVLGLLAFFYTRHYCRGGAVRSRSMSDSAPRRRGLLERQAAVSVEPFFGYPTTHQPVHSTVTSSPKEVARSAWSAPQATYFETPGDVTGGASPITVTSRRNIAFENSDVPETTARPSLDPPQTTSFRISSTELLSTARAATHKDGMTTSQARQAERDISAVRYEELARHMRDMDRQVAELQRRQFDSGNVSVGGPVSDAHGDVQVHSDTDSRRQIEALQMEVERLRVLAAAAMALPPPAYELDTDEES